MTDSNTIVPRTPESEAKLHRLVTLSAPAIETKQQATDLAEALVDFAEQAIHDDRDRISADLIALGETDLAVHFVLDYVLAVVNGANRG